MKKTQCAHTLLSWGPLLLLIASCGRCGDRDSGPIHSGHSDSDSGIRTDNDNDGYDVSADCNDNDPLINPGATEICDNNDNDCDGEIDEPQSVDDFCDGIDNDCDGEIDEDQIVEWIPNSGDTIDLTQDFVSASADSPYSLVIDSPGELRLCSAPSDSWYALITVQANVTITGILGAELTPISAGDSKSTVISIVDDLGPIEVIIDGITVRDGYGSCPIGFGFPSEGGGICCIGDAEVQIIDSTITNNYADNGGGLANRGCKVSIENTLIENNSALFGAGLSLHSGEVALMDSIILNNSASGTGGGLYVFPLSTDEPFVLLQDTIVSNNSADGGGGGVGVDQGGRVDCVASTAGVFGFVANSGGFGGAAYLTDGSVGLFGENCDMGSAEDNNDNSSPDVACGDNYCSVNISNDATFECTYIGAGCVIH